MSIAAALNHPCQESKNILFKFEPGAHSPEEPYCAVLFEFMLIQTYHNKRITPIY